MLRPALAFGVMVVVAAAHGSAEQRRPVLDDPARAVEAFLTLDTEGAQFTAAGWQRLSALVSEPGPREVRAVTVYEDWFVTGTAPGATADRAEVWAEGRVFGQYDPRTGLYHTTGFMGPMKFREVTEAVRVDGQWKVKGPMPVPGVTWQAVVRHATALRDSTPDARIKKNATITVSALTRWHPQTGKPTKPTKP